MQAQATNVLQIKAHLPPSDFSWSLHPPVCPASIVPTSSPLFPMLARALWRPPIHHGPQPNQPENPELRLGDDQSNISKVTVLVACLTMLFIPDLLPCKFNYVDSHQTFKFACNVSSINHVPCRHFFPLRIQSGRIIILAREMYHFSRNI